MIKNFWIVWRFATSTVSIKHETYESAHAEVERLAAKHPTETFYILRSQAVNKPVDRREWREYDL